MWCPGFRRNSSLHVAYDTIIWCFHRAYIPRGIMSPPEEHLFIIAGSKIWQPWNSGVHRYTVCFSYCVYYLLFFSFFPPEVVLRSGATGACPVTTDCIVAMSQWGNNNNSVCFYMVPLYRSDDRLSSILIYKRYLYLGSKWCMYWSEVARTITIYE